MAVCWPSARTFSLLRRPFQKTDLAGERLQIGFLESLHLVWRADHGQHGSNWREQAISLGTRL